MGKNTFEKFEMLARQLLLIAEEGKEAGYTFFLLALLGVFKNFVGTFYDFLSRETLLDFNALFRKIEKSILEEPAFLQEMPPIYYILEEKQEKEHLLH